MLDKARNEFIKTEEKYLSKFGDDSLDRVLLIDPLHHDESDLKEAINTLKESVRSGKPIEQIDNETWKNMIF